MRAFAEREDPVSTQRADFEELLTALHAAKTRRYDASLREEPLPLRPGIARLFDEAMPHEHLSLAIATTTTAANLDALLEPHFGHAWRERFAAVVSGSEIKRLKPEPDVYIETLRQLDLDAERMPRLRGLRERHPQRRRGGPRRHRDADLVLAGRIAAADVRLAASSRRSG